MKVKYIDDKNEIVKEKFHLKDLFKSLKINEEYIVYAITEFCNCS